MLQIRLSKGSAGEAGGGAPSTTSKPPPSEDIVTVACPDHLVIADLPVAKCVGAVTAASSAVVRTVGRRSRRNVGERVHFCFCCDFPIAIYGRLIPCGHAFCLACARSDASCYICEERIQKIQTIKMMEGLFMCAAPRCLKSFLKHAEWESHIHENHASLIQSNKDKQGENEKEARTSSTDTQKQSQMQEMSSSRAPLRAGFSSSFNSQQQDREERTRRPLSGDQQSPKPSLQSKLQAFPNSNQQQSGDSQPDSNLYQGVDRPNTWANPPQGYDNQSGRGPQQLPLDKPANIPLQTPLSDFQSMQPSHPTFPLAMNANPALAYPPTVNYPLPVDGSQQFLNAPFEMVQAVGPGQASLLGFSPTPAGITSFVNIARPWGIGLGMPFDPSMMIAQGISENYMNVTGSQGRIPTFEGDISQLPGGAQNHPQILQMPDLQGMSAVNNDDKGMLARMQQMFGQLPSPPPLPSSMPLQHDAGKFSSFDGNTGHNGQSYS